MTMDYCSAMGCPLTGDDDDGVIMVVTLTRPDDGVSLQFCRQHGERFLRNWAGLLVGTNAASAEVYAIVALTAEEHRTLLMSGFRTVLDHWKKGQQDG